VITSVIDGRDPARTGLLTSIKAPGNPGVAEHGLVPLHRLDDPFKKMA